MPYANCWPFCLGGNVLIMNVFCLFPECDRIFTTDNGRVTSPNYPANYPSRYTCSFTIRVPENNTISVFFRSFQLEYNSACRYDYLKVCASKKYGQCYSFVVFCCGLWGECPRGHFRNTYELLNLRALKFSIVNKTRIFQCMGKIFCVEFQRYPLRFHTKYLTHALQDMIFMLYWNFKSS